MERTCKLVPAQDNKEKKEFDDQPVEFEVDREGMQFLGSLGIAALALGRSGRLRRSAMLKAALIVLGVLLMAAATPILARVFWTMNEEYKKHWFGFMVGAFCIGLILIVNSVRGLGAIRRARLLLRK